MLNVISIKVSKMTSHCASTVQMRGKKAELSKDDRAMLPI